MTTLGRSLSLHAQRGCVLTDGLQQTHIPSQKQSAWEVVCSSDKAAASAEKGDWQVLLLLSLIAFCATPIARVTWKRMSDK
jgi:hypothetical protein